jgi:putative sigma-54 modulation protein
MLVHVRAQDDNLLAALTRHLKKRVRAALGPVANRISSVTLGVSDINGPHGGADLRCVLTVDLAPKGSVRAEATDSDLLSAVGRALARARRAILSDTRRERIVPVLGLAGASSRPAALVASSPADANA